MNSKENESNATQLKRVISAQAEVWEGSNGTVSEIKSKFDIKKNSGEDKSSISAAKVQSTPTKSKVAEIQRKIVNNTMRVEPNSTPSRSVNIPANKVVEMKQKITAVGEKSKAATFTPSRSINIPINKVNEIRKLLASLEIGARDNSEKTLSSKKRAVIDARMNKVSDIMKWIEDMTKQNKQGHQTSSRKGLELPVNRVHEMKTWLIDFERQNKEHFIEGSKPGNKFTITSKGMAATDQDVSQLNDNTIEIQKDTQIVDEETHTDVSAMIALLNELDRQQKKPSFTGGSANVDDDGPMSTEAIMKPFAGENQVHGVTANLDGIKISCDATSIKNYQVVSPVLLTQSHGEETSVESDRIDDQEDVDISMLPRLSDGSMSDESEDWEDIFAELSISSDEGLHEDDNGSNSDENIDGTEVRKLIDSFLNCDDSREQDADFEKNDEFNESSATLDYSDHEPIQSVIASTKSVKTIESHSVQNNSAMFSPGFNFEADFSQGLRSDELVVYSQPYLLQVMPETLVIKDDITSSMQESKSMDHPREVHAEKPSSTVLVPWRGTNKKIIIDKKAHERENKRLKRKRFGRKLLKVLKRIVRMSGNYESERSKQHHIALARTLSESEAVSSVISPLSRFSDDSMTPRVPNIHDRDIVIESYLPTAYIGKAEKIVDVIPFKGSLTPDHSVASAYENALSPDSSEGSSASNFALVLAKSINVTQHVQFMRDVFGSPTQRLGDKSGVVIGELSLVASSGAI